MGTDPPKKHEIDSRWLKWIWLWGSLWGMMNINKESDSPCPKKGSKTVLAFGSGCPGGGLWGASEHPAPYGVATPNKNSLRKDCCKRRMESLRCIWFLSYSGGILRIRVPLLASDGGTTRPMAVLPLCGAAFRSPNAAGGRGRLIVIMRIIRRIVIIVIILIIY